MLLSRLDGVKFTGKNIMKVYSSTLLTLPGVGECDISTKSFM